MRVLLETSPLRNAHSVRGVGVYTRYLSKELEKFQTQQLEIVTTQDSSLQQLNALMDKHAIDVIHYPYFDLFQQTLPFPFIKTLTGRKHQKIVVTIHDVIPLLYPDHYPVGVKGKVGFFLQKQLLQSVAAVITDSETSKKDIVQYLSYPLQKIHVVPLAGNPEIKKASASKISEVKNLYHLPEKFVLYVGDINYNKNIPTLLTAMQKVDEQIHLVCVGVNFREQTIPEWEAIQQVLTPVLKRVHFITDIQKGDSETLSAVYSAASAYVQPSLYEGFGLPVLEAIQCETLVVSSNTPALKEINGSGIEFVSPTSNDLSKGISTVVNLTLKEKKLRTEQNTALLSAYNWQKTARETIEVYTSLV